MMDAYPQRIAQMVILLTQQQITVCLVLLISLYEITLHAFQPPYVETELLGMIPASNARHAQFQSLPIQLIWLVSPNRPALQNILEIPQHETARNAKIPLISCWLTIPAAFLRNLFAEMGLL